MKRKLIFQYEEKRILLCFIINSTEIYTFFIPVIFFSKCLQVYSQIHNETWMNIHTLSLPLSVMTGAELPILGNLRPSILFYKIKKTSKFLERLITIGSVQRVGSA